MKLKSLISQSYRKKGQGLGKLLLQAVIQSCQSAGVERIFLEVRVRNFPAQALYLRMGFEIIGRRKIIIVILKRMH